MILTVLIFQLVTISFVTALEDFNNFKEGNCSDFPVTPIKVDRVFVDSLKYMVGGSRYHMYRTASSLPNYKTMDQFEFSSEACFTRNTTTSQWDSIGAFFGFGGRVLNTYRVTTSPGIYVQTVPRNPLTNSAGIRGVVTLTDNKNFAFITLCWTGHSLNDRAWTVVSRTPNIDLRTRKVIENHAVSLGFKRTNFVFLTYDKCHTKQSQN